MPSFPIFATSKQTDGSEFSITFNEPVAFPRNSTNRRIGVISATYWHVIPNITPSNNRLLVHGPSAVSLTMSNYPITIPTGLYSLNAINDYVAQQLANAGARTVDGPLIELIPHYATGHTLLKYNYFNTRVDFRGVTNDQASIGPTIGFPEEYTDVYADSLQTLTGPEQASLNSIEGLLLHTDVVNRGISYNGGYNQAIGMLTYDVEPGFQQVHEPKHITETPLERESLESMKLWLTDTNNKPIIMSEKWTVNLRVSYDL